jgi:hypothetical protein
MGKTEFALQQRVSCRRVAAAGAPEGPGRREVTPP